MAMAGMGGDSGNSSNGKCVAMQQWEVIVVMAAKGGEWQWQQWEVIVAMAAMGVIVAMGAMGGDSGYDSNGR